MILEFVVLFFTSCFGWLAIQLGRRKFRPPGPFPLPIVGNLFDIEKSDPIPHLAFHKLALKYGEVMTIKKGMVETVLLSSYDVLKEYFTKDEFTPKEFPEFLREPTKNKIYGFVFSSGEIWQESRRFAVRFLRDYGFGKKSSMDSIIEDEIKERFDHIKEVMAKNNGKVCFGDGYFNSSVLNLLWSYMAGYRFEQNDPRMKSLVTAINDFFKSTSTVYSVIMNFPILRPFFPNERLNKAHKSAHDFIDDELVNAAKKNPDYSNNPQCFLDIILREMDKNEGKGNQLFDRDSMKTIIFDLILGGAETSSNSIAWGVLYLLLNPHVQKKVQNEIDANIPPGSQITIADKQKLQYTWATILETFRCSTIVPIPIARQALKNTYIKGYFIKKGTPVMASQFTVNNDEKYWGDPKQFRPERFLNSNGIVIKTHEDHVTTFGFGKRFCPGENLANASMFVFLASFFQTFTISPIPGEPEPTIEPILGITLSPQSFNAMVKIRDM